MYDCSDVLPVPALGSVEPGTALLVSGPAMTGTDDLALSVLASGLRNGEGAIGVTTNDAADGLIATLRERVPEADPDRLAVIDCRGGDGADGHYENGYRYHVADPGDVTGMGVGITGGFDRLSDAGIDRVRFGLVSLSTMLTYADEETVFKFCHVLTSRIDTAGYVGVFTIDEGAHDQKTLQVVKQPFDGLIEVREHEGARQARLRGLEPEPSDWITL